MDSGDSSVCTSINFNRRVRAHLDEFGFVPMRQGPPEHDIVLRVHKTGDLSAK